MIILHPFSTDNNNFWAGVNYEKTPSGVLVHLKFRDLNKKLLNWYHTEAVEIQELAFKKENLWESSCFEVFCRDYDSKKYFELNLNSYGHWNLYEFESYRKRASSRSDCFIKDLFFKEIESGFDFAFIFEVHKLLDINKVNLAFSMVTLSESGTNYLAPIHPDKKPNFHHDKNFIFR